MIFAIDLVVKVGSAVKNNSKIQKSERSQQFWILD